MMQKCTVILKNVLEKESKGWYVKYKDKIIGELKGEKKLFGPSFLHKVPVGH